MFSVVERKDLVSQLSQLSILELVCGYICQFQLGLHYKCL